MTDSEQEQDQPEDEGASGPPGASEDEIDEIEEERKRRLAPENRPENTEIDNTGDNAPDLSRIDPAVDENAPADDGGDEPADDDGDEGTRTRGLRPARSQRGRDRRDRGGAQATPRPREPAGEHRGRQHRRQRARPLPGRSEADEDG